METIDNVVSLLVSERDRLNQAIQILSGDSLPKRRGRPPKTASAIPEHVTEAVSDGDASGDVAPRKKRRFTPAQRRAFGDRMKKYWAAKKRAEAKGRAARA